MGAAAENLQEEQNPGQSWPVKMSGPPRKSYSGAGIIHGTACLRGQHPGAAATHPAVHTGGLREPNYSRRMRAKRQVGSKLRKKSSPAGRSNTAKGAANPRSVAGEQKPGQAAKSSRSRSGTSAERKAATNDPSGRRPRNKSKSRDAWQENRRGARIGGVGAAIRERRSGMVRSWRLRTAQRGQRTLKGAKTS